MNHLELKVAQPLTSTIDLLAMPSGIRASIWRYLRIIDLGNLFRVCKLLKSKLETEDFKHLALVFMQLKGLGKKPNSSDSAIKTALITTCQINKLFILRFPQPSSDPTIIGQHEQVEGEMAKEPQLQLIRQTNAIDVNDFKVRNAFLAYLSPNFKNLLLSIMNGQPFNKNDAKEKKLVMKKGEMEVNLKDLIQNDDLFNEFIAHGCDVAKLLTSFGFQACETKKFEEQIKKLMCLCAVLKLFKCTPADLRQSNMTPSVKDLLLDKWDIVNKLLTLTGEVSLKRFLQIDEDKRYQMIQSFLALTRLVEDRMFTLTSLEKSISLGTLCNAHKMHQVLTHLYANLDEQVRTFFLKEPKLVERMYEQSEYLQVLVDHHNFNLASLPEMDAEDGKNFVNYSREVLKLCRFGIIKIDQLFSLPPDLLKKLLKNINDLSALMAFWEFFQKNLFYELSDHSEILEFTISLAPLLLSYAMNEQISFRDFIEDFEKISDELKKENVEAESKNISNKNEMPSEI